MGVQSFVSNMLTLAFPPGLCLYACELATLALAPVLRHNLHRFTPVWVLVRGGMSLPQSPGSSPKSLFHLLFPCASCVTRNFFLPSSILRFCRQTLALALIDRWGNTVGDPHSKPGEILSKHPPPPSPPIIHRNQPHCCHLPFRDVNSKWASNFEKINAYGTLTLAQIPPKEQPVYLTSPFHQ